MSAPRESPIRTRAEHLAWCKSRAWQELDAGGRMDAFLSICSDLGKHPETEHHPQIHRGLMMIVIGGLSTDDKLRAWIDEIN